MEDLAKTYFFEGITDRERAIFEGAITLAAIRHQFVGVPICKDGKIVKTLEAAIKKTMLLQPFKKDVIVKIDYDLIKGEKKHPYDYESLKARHMDIRVIVQYGRANAILRMRYVPELDFNLMYVEKAEEVSST
ncbi:MAG: hypothetical protein JSV20_01585 [Candidatus Bathyarchaeota archaeon]|nr:MAG: hypothetical protein JSV20_01585 [Candidatus Bathyarchaeota archaeon]